MGLRRTWKLLHVCNSLEQAYRSAHWSCPKTFRFKLFRSNNVTFDFSVCNCVINGAVVHFKPLFGGLKHRESWCRPTVLNDRRMSRFRQTAQLKWELNKELDLKKRKKIHRTAVRCKIGRWAKTQFKSNLSVHRWQWQICVKIDDCQKYFLKYTFFHSFYCLLSCRKNTNSYGNSKNAKKNHCLCFICGSFWWSEAFLLSWCSKICFKRMLRRGFFCARSVVRMSSEKAPAVQKVSTIDNEGF